MIKSIHLLGRGRTKRIDFSIAHEYKIIIKERLADINHFTLKIELDFNIKRFRNHDYKWIKINKRRLANWYSPKLALLDNDIIVQANQTTGICEVNPKQKNQILWYFKPQNANPIADYNKDNSKAIFNANNSSFIIDSLEYLFVKEGLELSRSKYPFSAIACFTDHCDFDTLAN